MSNTIRVITEQDIITARQRVAAAEAAGQQQGFEDALLASADLTPDMVRHWIDCIVKVRWCACEAGDHSRIVCTECGLPPYWQLTDEARAALDAY